ncbi:MAG: hypothetical protein K2X77_33345 [Candidatus Obscuribacterales bacterium]|nr:hypothetical protein [Candidatus Obscuribacterales bacterium]
MLNLQKNRLFALLLALAVVPSSIAADTTGSSSSSTTTTAATGAALQGNVKALDVEAAEGLRQMGDVLKKIQRASLELMGEATRQDYISVGDPDVVGTIIIPALPDPSGMMAIGPYLPIREKMMDYYLDQIGKLIPIYASLTDGLVLPESTRAQGIALMDTMRPLFEDARTRYMNLLNMSKELKTMKNMTIAKEAVLLHDDMQKIDGIRRSVFKLLKDSEKK